MITTPPKNDSASSPARLEARVGKANDGSDAISISIGTESITLDAANLQELVQRLAAARAKMSPPTLYDKPKTGEAMSVIRNPAATVNHSFVSSSLIVSLHHPGLGRVSYEFSKELANGLCRAIVNQLRDLESDESSERH